VSVACGLRHTCAVLNDGTAACWGGNGFGQLGTTLADPQLTPTPVMGGAGFTSVVAGRLHTCALAGAMPTCWGDGGRGQLGSGTSTPRAMPLPILYTGVATGLATGAAAEHACLWDATGVSCWGANSAGQLGDGTVDTAFMPVMATALGTATSVAVGGAGGGARGYTCAIDALGVVRCVGDNGLGQLGDGTRIDSMMPSEVALRRE
jgi:alpha-tubulin suppressor-like RCC1 family protein